LRPRPRPGSGARPRLRLSGRRASSPPTSPTVARSARATRSPAKEPDTPIAVEIYDGATSLVTVTADRLRSGRFWFQGQNAAAIGLGPKGHHRPETEKDGRRMVI
jgi:hypothetical protein